MGIQQASSGDPGHNLLEVTFNNSAESSPIDFRHHVLGQFRFPAPWVGTSLGAETRPTSDDSWATLEDAAGVAVVLVAAAADKARAVTVQAAAIALASSGQIRFVSTAPEGVAAPVTLRIEGNQ